MQYEPTAYDLGIADKPEADMAELEPLDRQVERDLEFFAGTMQASSAAVRSRQPRGQALGGSTKPPPC